MTNIPIAYADMAHRPFLKALAQEMVAPTVGRIYETETDTMRRSNVETPDRVCPCGFIELEPLMPRTGFLPVGPKSQKEGDTI